MLRVARPLLLTLIVMLPLGAGAAIDAYPFPNEELRARYNALIDELRCPTCLNTNIAGSDAMIAKDLRRETHRLLLEGKSDEEILDFMQQRYGDFILYKPRLSFGSFVLWFGPVIIFIIALYVVVRIARGRPAPARELDAQEEARLKQLLSDK